MPMSWLGPLMGLKKMPIRPENMRRYPGGSIHSPEWKAIRESILERAGGFCEHNNCLRRNGDLCRREDGSEYRVVLTVAHLDHKPENNDPANLRAMCQRCHNAYDAPHRQANARARRERERRRHADHEQGQLFNAEPVRGIL